MPHTSSVKDAIWPNDVDDIEHADADAGVDVGDFGDVDVDKVTDDDNDAGSASRSPPFVPKIVAGAAIVGAFAVGALAAVSAAVTADKKSQKDGDN